MIGSGLGGLAILALMFVFPPDFLIYPLVGLAVIPAVLSCFSWSPQDNKPRLRIIEATFTIIIAVISYALLLGFGRLSVSDFKPVSYAQRFPDSRQVYSSFSPLGEIKVYDSSFFHFAPGLSDTASVSLTHMPRNAFLGLYVDGDGPVGVMRRLSPQEERYIDFLPMSAPYLLLNRPRVLLLRLGGAADIFTALHKGASEVWVVEPNHDLIHMMQYVPFFQSFTGRILDDPRVKVVNTEIRAFAGSTNHKFDLVELGLIDSTGLSQAGGYSVEENYTYTVEAMREYLKSLNPSGVLSITVWDRLNPPRNVPRLLATVVQALREEGIQNVDKDIYSFNLLLSTATVLIKKDGFSVKETTGLNTYCRRMSFDVNYFPGMASEAKTFDRLMEGYSDIYSGNPESPVSASQPASSAPEMDLRPADLYHLTLEWLLANKQAELFSRYVFDIRPATDDRPYYAGYLKPLSIPQFLPRLGEISEEWGYLLLLATFLQSIIFGALIIMLPLILRWRELFRGRRGTLGIIVYYACLGLAYLMAEIFLIQRFVFFLANPVYANSIIITILLIASGVGSLVSERIQLERRVKVLTAVMGIGILVLVFLFAVPPLLQSCLGLPLWVKVLITSALVAPMGFFMGVPFPTGLASLSESRKGILPWAWGVNGALSVTGSVLTRLVSTSLGFSVVLAGVAFLYILAGVLFPVNESIL
jgi:predicted membrane-bound spermidine synthase